MWSAEKCQPFKGLGGKGCHSGWLGVKSCRRKQLSARQMHKVMVGWQNNSIFIFIRGPELGSLI